MQGLDTHYPIVLNFGRTPFVFDLYEFDKNAFGCDSDSGLVPIQTQLCAVAECPELIRRPKNPLFEVRKSSSMFANKALLHRSLRIIDPEVYRFQV